MRPFAWLSAATAAALMLSTSTVAAQDFFLSGVNYNIRKGPDAAAPADKCKDAAQIARELALLANVTDVVRLYSLVDCDQAHAAIPAIFAAGLKLELGLWVGKHNAVYADEREALKKLLANKTLLTTDNVVSIHVGSEAIYREDVDAKTAIANLREIQQLTQEAGLTVPVSVGDIGDSYLAHPELFEAVDFVEANLFPFWEQVEASKAAEQFYARYQQVADAAATYQKQVVVGETGWASGGKHAGASEASPQNAATFFHDFYLLAKERNITYYYFAAFDEAWKLQFEDAESTVEGYFGLFTADGKLKDEYAALELDSAAGSGGAGGVTVGDEEEGEENKEDEEDKDEEDKDEEDKDEEEEELKPAHVKPGDVAHIKIAVHRHKVAVVHNSKH